MSNVFTLSNFRKAADAKYAPLQIDVSKDEDGSDLVNLIPVLRLSKEKRKEFSALQEERKSAEHTDFDDLEDFLHRFIEAIAETPAQAKKLLDQPFADLAFLSEVISEYSERTSPGEASSSES